MQVAAPKGYHWMKSGKTYKLMKDPAGGYKPTKALLKKPTLKYKRFIKNNGDYIPTAY